MARPFYNKVDWTIVMSVLVLAAISLTTLYGASASSESETGRVVRQAGWFMVGLVVMVVVTSIDYHILSSLAYPIYLAVVLALAAVLAVGEVVQGAQRWIKIGSISVQPSEMSKIALILVLAKYFSDKKKDAVYLTDVLVSAILLGIPVALIFKEPDLGMTALLFPIFVAMVYVAGIDIKPMFRILLFRPLLITIAVAILASSLYKIHLKDYWQVTDSALMQLQQANIPVDVLERLSALKDKEYGNQKKFIQDLKGKIGEESTTLYQAVILRNTQPKVRLILAPVKWVWLNLLKEYQRTRIRTFFDPNSDPLGSGYHIIQSQIAIGSGGFWGKGYMNGTQNQLKFLPEQYTDFIFSVFSEEWGFIGSVVLLSAYMVLILKGLFIAAKAKDKLGRLIAVGVVTIFMIHTFVNVGVTTGIMPVTGLTLLFMSYGGSSIFSTSVALGLLLNVGYRRFDFI